VCLKLNDDDDDDDDDVDDDDILSLWLDHNDQWDHAQYTGWAKKVSQIIFAITLSTASQFS